LIRAGEKEYAHSISRVTVGGDIPLVEHVDNDIDDDIEDAESEEEHRVVLGQGVDVGN